MNAAAPLCVTVAGIGKFGHGQALADHLNSDFELVDRTLVELPAGLAGYRVQRGDDEALAVLAPDVVCVLTHADSHADWAIGTMERGANVFVEKPLATTVEDVERIVVAAKATGRKLVVGFVPRHHPSWQYPMAEARILGSPCVFGMNLNQQSSGPTWQAHERLMQSTLPIVDCAVHDVDVMFQFTDARPVQLRGMGLRHSDEIAPDMDNDGHLLVVFDDGSVDWCEAAWAPMISETAFFVEDVRAAKGAVSIVMDENATSDDIDTHAETARIRLHKAETDLGGSANTPDVILCVAGEPEHKELYEREQVYVLKAIKEDIDLSRHMRAIVEFPRICLAVDRSARTGEPVAL